MADANQPPNSQAPPCDVYLCIGEQITLHARYLTVGSPVGGVWFNLYNSNFYDPIYASRQLLLDTSASGDPFSFADLFLHGPETLTEFQSYRPPNIAELRAPVLLPGPYGTVASGRFLSLAYVPPGVGGASADSGRWCGPCLEPSPSSPHRSSSVGDRLKRQGCDHHGGW